MTDNIYWILKCTVNAGQLDALKALAPSFCEATRAEAGVLAYEWSLSADGTQLHVYERYANSDAGLAHLGSIGPRLGELFALVTPTVIEVYGAASDAFKEATAEMPTVFFDQFDGFCK